MATRKVTHLNIWMNGLLVGQWGKKAGVEELSYAQSWVESEQGRPLSVSLPFNRTGADFVRRQLPVSPPK